MRLQKGERTAEILRVLSRKDATAEAVAKTLKAGGSNIASLLLRLIHSGHVKRATIQHGTVVIDEDEGITRPKHVFLYSITPKGEERLEWLTKSAKENKKTRS